MKSYLKHILLATIMFCYISCEDRLEVVDENSLAAETVFNSFNSINGAVVGLYSLNQSGDLNGNPQLISDFMADNVNFVGSFTSLQDLEQFETLATNTTIDNIWEDGYQLINAANGIINNVPGSPAMDITDEEKAGFMAEAKFLRALTYFTLVNLWAQPFQFDAGNNLGVPLQTNDFKLDIAPFQLERSTVNEVHAFIQQDLMEAIEVLPTTSERRLDGSDGRATIGAAQGLLARLYLYREQWEEAANLANAVIDSGDYTLAPNYDFYDDNPTSSEHIFLAINTPSDFPQEATTGSDEVYATFYTPVSLGGRGDAPFSDDLIAAFNEESGDRRFAELSLEATDALRNEAIFTTKYPDPASGSSDGMILRITEMYLIRAEANLRNGTAIGDSPLNDINLLRDRAGLADLPSVDLDAILNERRKEFCFEGHRRMDLLRNNLNLRPDGGPESAPGANKVIFPIVDDELQNNPNITQNPGAF